MGEKNNIKLNTGKNSIDAHARFSSDYGKLHNTGKRNRLSSSQYLSFKLLIVPLSFNCKLKNVFFFEYELNSAQKLRVTILFEK